MGTPRKKETFEEGAQVGRISRFEDLARLQGVRPVENPDDLLGGWPGDVNDGFEEAVSAWRRWDLSFQK